MSKVDGYSIYQQNVYKNSSKDKADKTQQNRGAATGKAGEADKAGKAGNEVQLSERAKELLKELQKKYGNMDFIVANYGSEREAQDYLSRGTKEFSVLIEPETLEEMAASEDSKNKYMKLIEDSAGQLTNMKDQLSDDKKGEVVHLGVSIKDDGTVSYFADLEQMSARQRERIEQAREERQEEKKQEEVGGPSHARAGHGMPEAVKKTRVQADSVDDLLKRINQVDWSQVRGQGVYAGGRFDFMF